MLLRRQIMMMCAFASAIALVTLAVLNFAPLFVAPIVAFACGLSSWLLLLFRSAPGEDATHSGFPAGDDS